jgi:hypothetical protein
VHRLRMRGGRSDRPCGPRDGAGVGRLAPFQAIAAPAVQPSWRARKANVRSHARCAHTGS